MSPKVVQLEQPKGSVRPSRVSPVPPMVHSRVGRAVQSHGTSANPNNLPRRLLRGGFIASICTHVCTVLARTGVGTWYEEVHLHLCCREIATFFVCVLKINRHVKGGTGTLKGRTSREEPQGKKQAAHFLGSGISSKTGSYVKKHQLNSCKGHGEPQTPAITFQRNFGIWESKAI